MCFVLVRQGQHHCDADDVGWIVCDWLHAAKKRNISNIPGGIRSAINRTPGRGAKNHAALNI